MAGFLPVVAPASVIQSRTDEFYKIEEETLFAIADALHEEYAAVVESGLLVQIDDAFLASSYDVMVPPATLADYRDERQCGSMCSIMHCAAFRREVPLSCVLG